MSLFDIARSGIRTYQTALSVTAENIANVHTDGYARQEVRLTGIAGAAATATSQASGGGGVTAEEVARVFSDLLADRTRFAGSVEAAAGQRADGASAVEAFFTPGQGGIDASMADFYSALTNLTGSPASLPVRQVVLQAGNALAGQIADVAAGLADLRDGIGKTAEIAVAETNAILTQLAHLNADFRQSSAAGLDTNTLATSRDHLLSELSQRIGINTTLDARGRVDVTMAGTGATLVSGGEATPLTTDLTDRLELGAGTDSFTLISGGILGGLSDAVGMVDAAIADLNQFAGHLAAAANAMQTGGTDLSGDAGAPMFSMTGWSASTGLSNAGAAQVSTTMLGDSAPAGPISLTKGTDNLWTARDAEGTVLGSGTNTIVLDALRIDISGPGSAGDSFDLTRRDGQAADMQFLLTDATTLAAATRLTLQPVSGNSGTAAVSMAPVPPPATGIVALDDLLGQGANSAAAVSLRGAGIVGSLPVQGGNLSLASVAAPSRATFTAGAAVLSSASQLRLTTPDGAVTFDLTTLADGTSRPTTWGATEIAAALNDGRFLAGSTSLADLGAHAAGQGGQLQIALAEGDISAARLTTNTGNVDASLTPSEPAGGQVQIFSRNGVHIAGTPLTAAEAAALITQAHGFLPGATYDASHLNADYRGTDVIALTIPGAQAIDLPMGGLSTSTTGAIAPVAARPVSIALAGQGNASITVPEGASAAQAADLMNRALPGLAATASTAVSLQVPDGVVSFELSGENAIPVTITANVTGGDLTAIAERITATSDATGLRAEMSPDGSRLLVVSDSGETIDFGAFTHSAGSAMTVAEAQPDGTLLGPQAQLGAGAGAVRVTGQVTLTAATAFSTTANGTTSDSVANPAHGGLFSLTTTDAGATRQLNLAFDPALDGANSSGADAAAAGTTYSVTLGGHSVAVSAATIGADSAADVASALATALRANTPSVELRGEPMSPIPANGSSLGLIADGQAYTLTMRNGQPVVTGPEAGRITATLSSDNRLTLRMTGSTDGSGIRVAQPSSSQAHSFGFAGAAMQLVRGQSVSPASLSAGGVQLPVRVNGVSHFLTVAAGGSGVVVSTPAGFPGSATVDADGAISLWVRQDAGAVTIGSVPDAGFDTLGAAVSAGDNGLTIRGAEGAVPDLSFTAESDAPQRLSLSGLPPEELLVGMTGTGPLHLAGGATAGTPTQPQLMLQVVDAAQGEIALLDAETGDRIGSGFLDAEGQATVAGYAVTLGQGAVTGDRYVLTSASAGSADGANLQNLLSTWSGAGGLTEEFNLLVSDIGSQTAATATALTAATDRSTAAQKAESTLSAVDLDTEAARLLELQQAYQGSAKALTVARDLFDTLLKAI